MRKNNLIVLSAGLGILTAGAFGVGGCDNLPTGPMSFSGTADGLLGGDGLSAPTGGGVGEDCDDSDPCRGGLTCNTEGVCEPGGSQQAGSGCVIGAECADGLSCNVPGLPCDDGSLSALCCGPAGAGEVGDACQTDLECGSGLRCAILGFSSECVEAGTADFGQDCVQHQDCFQGLFCIEGSCDYPVPPYGVPLWEGVSCGEQSDENVIAHFKVPGAADTPADADFFSLPFPNDVRLEGGKPNLDGFPTPGPELLGVDVVQSYVDAIEEKASGWSANSSAVFRFSGNVDFDTLSVKLVDTADFTGNPGVDFSWSPGRTNYVCDDWLAARPKLGAPLVPGHTYAMYVLNQVKDDQGADVTRDPQFEAMLAESTPSDSALAAAHAAFEPLRTYVAGTATDDNENNDVTLDDILVATVFTVEDPIEPMRQLASSVEAEGAPTVGSWVKCSDGVASPCSDVSEGRACGNGTGDYDEYHALIELPIFQEGEAPYQMTGGGIASTKQRDEQVCMSITVPKTAAPADGWPLVVYGHGTGGTFRSHVRDEVAGNLARAGMAVVGIDEVQHGPRRNSEEDPDVLFFNFLNPDAARGNPMQGAADQLSILAWAQNVDLDAGTTGGDALKIDGTKVMLYGHSQGSTHGSLALPLSDFPGAVLSGNGGSLVHALLNKTQPVNIAGAIPVVLQDLASDGSLNMGDKHPVLGLLQHYIDPADPLNFAPLVAERPEASVGGKHVFQTYGLDDSYSPPLTLTAYVRAAGMAVASPPSGVNATGDNDLGIAATAGEISANAPAADPAFTVVARQYDDSSDGHFVVFNVAAAQDDVVDFLSDLSTGAAPTAPAP